MAIERTLSIVKPDAVAKNHIGDIFARFEKNLPHYTDVSTNNQLESVKVR